MGVSQVIIGLSLVAIGTSIPELATSVVASIKGEQGLAVGGVVGSNLFNILGILGITALLDSIFGGELNLIDFGVMLAYAVILLPFAWTNLQISRKEGIALLAGYIAYMFYIYTSG
jgi:cation:H+ antiporter